MDGNSDVDIPSRSLTAGYIVEFFGLSGVGKSTLAKALEDELKSRRIPVSSYPGKMLFFANNSLGKQRWLALSSVLQRPVGVGSVFIALSKDIYNGNKIHGDKLYKLRVLVKWLKRWAIYIDSVNKVKKKNEISILDRGIGTNLLSIITRIDINNIQSLANALAATHVIPDLVIVVDAEQKIIERRRNDRGDNQKFWQLDWNYEHRKYMQVLDHLNQVLQSTNGKLIHVTSDSQDSIEMNVNKIADYLTNIDN